MAKVFVILALFALVAVALGATQAQIERPVVKLSEGKPLVESKAGDLQTASSLYGGFIGGYGGPYGYGFGYGYPFYGHGYYGGFGYGYPYFGGYAHGFAY